MPADFLTVARYLRRLLGLVVLAGATVTLATENTTALTEQDQRSLLSAYGLSGNGISRIDGIRRHDSAKAGANVYGQIRETKQGTCVTWHLFVIGNVVDNAVQWMKEDSPRYDQVIWLSDERKGRPCTDMLDNPTISLESYIEENTIRRIHRQSLALALEAGRQLRQPISPSEILKGRTTRLAVTSLGERIGAGTYQLTWTIDQCLGLGIAVRTDSKGDFEVVEVRSIVC